MNFTAGKQAALLLGGALCAGSVCAEDISRELRRREAADANYLELGVGMFRASGPTRHGMGKNELGWAAILNGRFQWKGLFIENHTEDTDGVTLGYSVVDRPDWSLDLLLTSKHSRTRHDDAAFRSLDTRADRGAGLRLSGNASDYAWQLNVWKDVGGIHDGFGASAQLGRSWQFGNWNLHALAGVNHSSARVLDYYYGVTAQQSAATGLATYRAGSGLSVAAEVGASYPLARNWVLRSALRANRAASSVSDSSRWREPKNLRTSALLSISHVF